MKCTVKLERVIVESTEIEIEIPDGSAIMPAASNTAIDAVRGGAAVTWTQQSVDGPMFAKLISPVIVQE